MSPVDANEVELSSFNRRDMIWTMPQMLGDEPKPPVSPVALQAAKR